MSQYQGYQQGYDDEDDQNQWGQTRQQQRGDEDNNDINDQGDDGTEYANNGGWGQQPEDDRETALQQSDNEGDAPNTRKDLQQTDDEDDRETALQQSDNEGDAQNTQKELQQTDDEDDDQRRTRAQDDDNCDDGQEAPKSSNVNINLNINLAGDLENSDLHEGGIIFSKKLLAQLFSGPGEHDPQEEEVPMHQIQHEHVDAAASGEWTVVELKTQDAEGATIYLKAKLDSGADDNFMSSDTFEVTGLDIILYEGPEGPPSFTMGGGQQSQPLGTVRLEYTAGIKPQKFIETFQVLEGLPHDVIIGKPLMTRAHMMMVNPNFANPPGHPGLCLMELPPKDKASKAKALALQKQRAKEQSAAYEAKLKAQEAAAPKSGSRKLVGKH